MILALRVALLVFVFVTGTAVNGFGQKQFSTYQQTWLGYNNQTRLSDKWGIWFDGHIRTKDHLVEKLSVSIVRPGVIYYLNDNSRLAAGYAWVHNFPWEGHANVARPEHRIWQQYQWLTRYNRLRTSQYLRLEERFRRKVANDNALADGYNFTYRLRYSILLTVPIGKITGSSSKWSAVVNDEAMVGFGKETVYNYFDQNRFFVGLALQTKPTDNFQFGYLNVFQQMPQGNRYRVLHAPRLYYYHNLDLRKK